MNYNSRKKQRSDEHWPVSKRPRINSNSNNIKSSTEDDDPFADDDITGEELEEWEFVASQAEIKLTQQKTGTSNGKVDGFHQNGIGSSSTFKMPAPKTNHVNHNFQSSATVDELQKKMAIYEKQIKELEQANKRKDGETMILRDRLSKTEKDLTQQKVKVIDIQKRYDDAEIEHDKKLQKELERYKDQVQFKDAEIMESQNLIKNLEAKNKLLEQHKNSGTSGSIANNTNNGFHDTVWTNSQSEYGTSAAKKIRLVKPESPRVLTSHLLNKPSFNDDPLGRKRPIKSSPNKPSSSSTMTSSPAKEISSSASEESAIDWKRLSKLKLKSSYLSNESSAGQMIFGKILSTTSEHPFIHLLNRKHSKRKSASFESLHTLLMQNCETRSKVFGNLCLTHHRKGKNVQTFDEEYEILSLIDSIFNSYIDLQDSVCANRLTSQDTSSFHTAPLEQPASTSTIPLCTLKTSIADKSTICEDAYAAIQVLCILVENSQTIAGVISNQCSGILMNLLKMCSAERWNSSFGYCEKISSVALNILNTLAKFYNSDQLLEKLITTLKPEVLIPLITHQNIEIKKKSLNLITTLSHHSSFVLSAIDEKQSDTPNLLCHVCDICCARQPQHIINEDWLLLLTKVLTLLSILISEHESMLVDHSCYAEIYRAADVLLHNQLVSWKKGEGSFPERFSLIQRALCLLHSCANVYNDAIPGSRRDHRHQLVLTNLEEFLSKHEEQSSFWSQELNRIVKSEVHAIFEEVDNT